MSLALVEQFLDRLLIEAQVVSDFEEVDLLRGADDFDGGGERHTRYGVFRTSFCHHQG